MLVSHIRHLQEHEGVTELHDAVFRGALERLAPILMTALAAGLALIPLALRGQARQRDSNADGHRHLRGPADVDGAQHAGRAGALSPVRSPVQRPPVSAPSAQRRRGPDGCKPLTVPDLRICGSRRNPRQPALSMCDRLLCHAWESRRSRAAGPPRGHAPPPCVDSPGSKRAGAATLPARKEWVCLPLYVAQNERTCHERQTSDFAV